MNSTWNILPVEFSNESNYNETKESNLEKEAAKCAEIEIQNIPQNVLELAKRISLRKNSEKVMQELIGMIERNVQNDTNSIKHF